MSSEVGSLSTSPSKAAFSNPSWNDTVDILKAHHTNTFIERIYTYWIFIIRYNKVMIFYEQYYILQQLSSLKYEVALWIYKMMDFTLTIYYSWKTIKFINYQFVFILQNWIKQAAINDGWRMDYIQMEKK